jgi:hypothetical protein
MQIITVFTALGGFFIDLTTVMSAGLIVSKACSACTKAGLAFSSSAEHFASNFATSWAEIVASASSACTR